ncbi:hypothetical protein ACFO0S_10400 [Chryseomicrobium palamuruense]|uniref:Uncharacterized protein n=1 Tax=Chryseomicrobium palamuruense TaxID=682973 RepID=A0ABV8UVY6_9BACL
MFTFGFTDFFSLLISAFLILPIVIFMRELGYVIVTFFIGVDNPRLTIGSGPRLFRIGMFDVRKYYHLYSWFSYDELKHKNKWIYIIIYSAPILMNILLGISLNLLLANGYFEDMRTFWDRFIFYVFYYVLFDIVPMRMIGGKPNNGMIIYEILRYGKRTDYHPEPFLPSTSESEREVEKSAKEAKNRKI